VSRQLSGAAEGRSEKAREDSHTINLGHDWRETIMEMYGNGTASVLHTKKMRNEE
jgi:hypothetical protein